MAGQTAFWVSVSLRDQSIAWYACEASYEGIYPKQGGIYLAPICWKVNQLHTWSPVNTVYQLFGFILDRDASKQTRGLRGLIQQCAILRKDSRCQKESNHQRLICRNFSSYIESFANRPRSSLRKRKLLISQSIPFYEVNLIIWMDAKSIYLTYREY